jgi:hypothetical protein
MEEIKFASEEKVPFRTVALILFGFGVGSWALIIECVSLALN